MKAIVWVVCGAACLLGIATLAAAHITPQPHVGLLDPPALETRAPIVINGDAAFTAANGVRGGDGSAARPFTIANWSIVGTATAGVFISNTTAEFVVTNVRVSQAWGALVKDGVRLSNVTGGMIDHVLIDSTDRFGVYMEDTAHNSVCTSIVQRSGYIGVYAHASSDLLWRENHVADNDKHGMYLGNLTLRSRITGNTVTDNIGWGRASFGIYSGLGSNDVRVDNNTAYGNGAGIQLTRIARNVVEDNLVMDNLEQGVGVIGATDSVLRRNIALGHSGGRGLGVSQSVRTLAEDNVLRGGAQGVLVEGGSDNVVTRNIVLDNRLGVWIAHEDEDAQVFDNILDNFIDGQDDTAGAAWSVPPRTGPNLAGGALVAGNHWAPHAPGFTDDDGDGIADEGSVLVPGDAGARDDAPLAGGHGLPGVSFTVTPARPVTGEAFTLRAVLTTGSFPISKVRWDIGGAVVTGDTVVTRTLTEPGDVMVVLRATDAAGRTDAAGAFVAVTNQPPVAVVAGVPTVVTRGDPVTFDASASTDPDGVVARYAWDFGDGATVTCAAPVCGGLVEHTYEQAGTYAVSVLVTDDVGGTGAASLTVVVDRTAPVTAAAVAGPAQAGWFTAPPTVTLTAVDAFGIDRIMYRLGDTDWSRYDGAFAVPPGDHAVAFFAIDVAGNVESTRTVPVRVDTQPPTAAVAGPDVVNGATPLRVEAVDDASGVQQRFVRIGNGAERRVDGPFTLAGNPEGAVVTFARAVDVAGHASETVERAFLLDLTPPQLHVQHPARGHVYAAGTWVGWADAVGLVTMDGGAAVVGDVPIEVHASDAVSYVARLTASVDGVIVAVADGPYLSTTWTPPAGTLREVQLTITAVDAAGLTASVTRTVLVAATPEVPA